MRHPRGRLTNSGKSCFPKTKLRKISLGVAQLFFAPSEHVEKFLLEKIPAWQPPVVLNQISQIFKAILMEKSEKTLALERTFTVQ